MSGYPSDVSDEQWVRIAAFFPAQTGPGRRRTVDLRRGGATFKRRTQRAE